MGESVLVLDDDPTKRTHRIWRNAVDASVDGPVVDNDHDIVSIGDFVYRDFGSEH